MADRYVVEDLLAQEAGSESWRARDRILARSVVLQLLPSTSPNASPMLTAAKRASRVADSRILQVLDAADDGSLSYIVREWASGQSLDVVLSEGPLPARRSTWLLREVAGAMVNAHRMGLPHGRLVPDCVVITKSSGVKLIGLGTSAVLRAGFDDHDRDAELEDTIDLGRLLYACLTARWPGGDWHGLPAAPTEHGRLLRPRQVRAGVPRTLDAVCDRILTEQSRCGDPITTVTEVKEVLTQILADEGLASPTAANGTAAALPSSPQHFEPPPALLLRDGESPPTGEQPIYADPPGEGSTLGRTLTWSVALVLILGVVLLAYLIGQHGNDPLPTVDHSSSLSGASGPTSKGASSSPGLSPVHPLTIAGVTSFDPPSSNGSGDENPDETSYAFDGNPATSWTTLEYQGPLSLQKPGVGLVVDLGSVQDVSGVKVGLGGNGTSLQLRAAPETATSEPTGSYEDYQLLDTITQAGSSADFALAKPVRTRYLLVWLTSLPSDGNDVYRGQISEIQVLG